ncbi:ISVisp4 transposase OrfB [Providencia burhodogranariea DSM 19968]|uniref:ISVisp4 transposase OrfB n=1 Tax=Providencia burhodogranariea DSM 19968 TaxID=1141662 RepID=K8WDG5_9GAMM|nr:ISVisp4 transposase OrfB [Providencia burhodogranariea DSM 19968]
MTDAYARKIVGCHLDNNMKIKVVEKSLVQALKRRSSTTSLVYHFDCCLQYCSSEYQKIHKKYNIQYSMTDGYDSYQNAQAKRVNEVLKMDYRLINLRNLAEAIKLIEESIQIHNEKRPMKFIEHFMSEKVVNLYQDESYNSAC